MIFNLAEKAVDKFLSHEGLSPDDRELYVYGFFIILSRAFFFIVTLAFGLLFGLVLESILFYALFALIRGYAGGVHAATETMCNGFTLISFFASVAAMKACTVFSAFNIAFVSFVFSLPIILLLSPLDSAAKPLTADEKKTYRRRSGLFALLIFAAAVLAFVLRLPKLLYPCAASMLLESILLAVGKLKA